MQLLSANAEWMESEKKREGGRERLENSVVVQSVGGEACCSLCVWLKGITTFISDD